MRLIILFLFSSPIFALEFEDKMKAKVLKAYKNNYLVINRGLEDGIFKGEHIKLTNKAGYISRAICIKPRMLISHCKVYRVVRPELLSLDSDYVLSSIKQSEKPDDLKSIHRADFRNRFNDFTDKDINKSLPVQSERIANFDLVNDFDPNKYPLRSEKVPEENILTKNFDKKVFEKDLKRFTFSIFASPLSVQKQGSQYNQNLGLKAYNNGEKYDFALLAMMNNTKVANQYSDNSVEKKETFVHGLFELKDFSDRVSLVSDVRLRNQSFDGIKTPMNSNQVGAIGMRYYVTQSDRTNTFVQYIPTFESTSFQGNLNNQEVSESFIRHGMRINHKRRLSENFSYLLDLNFLPSFSFQETTTMMDLNLEFKMTEKLSLNYLLSYYSNSLISQYYDIASSDITNTINFRYDFDL